MRPGLSKCRLSELTWLQLSQLFKDGWQCHNEINPSQNEDFITTPG